MINNDNDYINRNMDGTLQRTPGMDKDGVRGGSIVALRDHPTRGYNASKYDENFESSGMNPMEYARLSRYNEADLMTARKDKWEAEKYYLDEAIKLEELMGRARRPGGGFDKVYDHSKFLAEDPKKVIFPHEIPGYTEGIQRGPENSFAESNREIKDIIDQVAQGKAKQAERAASLNSRPPVARPPVGTHASLDQPIASPAGGYADEYERNMTTAEGLDAENARRGGNPYEHQSTLIGLDYPNSPQDQLGWQMSALDRNLDNAISMGNSYIQDREEEEERKRQEESRNSLLNRKFTVSNNF